MVDLDNLVEDYAYEDTPLDIWTRRYSRQCAIVITEPRLQWLSQDGLDIDAQQFPTQLVQYVSGIRIATTTNTQVVKAQYEQLTALDPLD